MLFSKLAARVAAVLMVAASPALASDETARGGPYESAGVVTMAPQADANFKALFQSWKKMDGGASTVAVPSARPVDIVTSSSGYGIRVDPFRGTAAMHSGVDMPGPLGSPIYATANGIVGRATWAGGYGNLIEINHGGGIQTRYGHLSSMLVQPGQRVTRGQLVGRMGSTGRSTGSHLHYEVRLDGAAVNPMPFLEQASYVAAMTAPRRTVAMGGPASGK